MNQNPSPTLGLIMLDSGSSAKKLLSCLGIVKPQNAIQAPCKHSKLLKSLDSGHLKIPPRGLLVIPEGDVYRLVSNSNMALEVKLCKVFGDDEKIPSALWMVIVGNPWWIAKEVCEVLGLSNTTEALKSLDDDEKSEFRISEVRTDGVRRYRKYIIINEPGLYGLIIRTRKPEAIAFKRRIKHVILQMVMKVIPQMMMKK